MARHGVLEQDAVDVRIFVQLLDFGEQFFGRRLLRHVDRQTFHADSRTGVPFHFYVSGACRVVADKNRGENRGFSGAGLERIDSGLQLNFAFLGEFFTIEDKSRHRFSVFLQK